MFNFYDCDETRCLVYPKNGTYPTKEEAESVEALLKQEAEAPYSQIANCDPEGNPTQMIKTRIVPSGEGYLVKAILYDDLKDFVDLSTSNFEINLI